MIDGLKLICSGTAPKDWEHNDSLKFTTRVDSDTKEMVSDTKIAFHRGLQFIIKADAVCIIRGSLARFYNEGMNNAFDFDVNMLREAIKELQDKFNIDPTRAKIQTFEFGANIITVQPVNQIISGLRAYKKDRFTELKINNVFLGKQIPCCEYTIKIYDKALQVKKDKNLLRIELAVHKSRRSQNMGFTVLADFLNLEKLNSLKSVLLNIWADAIFYDKGMQWKKMSTKDKIIMRTYLDATCWENYTTTDRHRARKKFRYLYDLYCTSTTKSDVLELLERKLNKLTAVKRDDFPNSSKEFETQKNVPEVSQAETHKLTALKGDIFPNYSLEFETVEKKEEMSRFPPLSKEGKHDIKKLENAVKLPHEKKHEKTQTREIKKCSICSADISNQKLNSKYCSKKCSNVWQSEKRKIKRHDFIKNENENLVSIIEKYDKVFFELVIECKNFSLANILTQKQIIQNPKWRIKVSKISVLSSSTTIVLTSLRARKLLNFINQQISRPL